ncbi:uncharacterized protein G2W53_043979 [Senna tora]|uniref:Uncharacterized protein n=1 Tax=Senna tora TaxID=362788 RepID=A0A834SLM7_9FABA|nr:uncharacterized protein G2W53_043979 [Senna tora]
MGEQSKDVHKYHQVITQLCVHACVGRLEGEDDEYVYF